MNIIRWTDSIKEHWYVDLHWKRPSESESVGTWVTNYFVIEDVSFEKSPGLAKVWYLCLFGLTLSVWKHYV